jgi:hypothetical protein
MSETAKLYLILSKKWSENRSEFLVWYRPDSHGYTENLEEAGRFTEEEARAITCDGEGVNVMVRESDAYEFAVTRILVPVSEAIMNQLTGAPSSTFGRLAPICFSKGVDHVEHHSS